MSGIKDLPSAGSGFRATAGSGNFAKRFNSTSRVAGSALYNLRDNKQSILKVIKASEGAIRIGKFDRLRQKTAYNAVRKLEGSKLTKDDKKDLKLVLKHLGGGDEEAEGPIKLNHLQMQLDRDDSFEEERKIAMKVRTNRFERSGNGGESKLKFASHPNNTRDQDISVSGRLLQRRFNSREQMIKSKLPSNRIQRDMGAVAPPPAITREGEPHMPNPPSIGMVGSPVKDTGNGLVGGHDMVSNHEFNQDIVPPSSFQNL
jgi:hypothetical protein